MKMFTALAKGVTALSPALAVSLCLAVLTGCGGGSSTPTPPPPASIASFVASPTTITVGQSATLTGVFSNGTGVITPGNLSATSGIAVTVTPAATTTYTLTVTPSSGSAVTSTVIVTVNPAAPSIASFTASPATITAGQSSSLTADFTGGTGVITPGNLSVTSGTAITVTPAATTIYTLTVTPASGTAVTQTVTVTVDPAPTIASFSSNPATITAGQNATLTGVFASGTGVITPGNTSVTSGTGTTVSPTSTTTYTLTVTSPAGATVTATTTVTVASSVTVNLSTPGPAITSQLLGMNLAEWYDWPDNASSIISAFKAAGIKAIRWPGGSWSDDFHWGYQTGSNTLVTQYECQTASPVTGGWGGYSTFANFVNTIPLAGQYDLALTANYGTDEACTGGGDPNEAAAWAAAAVADGITPSHMTVGNEEYGTWETDLHASPHNPATYAAAVIGSSGYYNLIKAASPKTLVGVVVDAQSNCCVADWDSTVLGTTAGYFDFVEFHYYPQNPGQENDTFLVQQAPQELTTNINTLKAELATAGKPNTPIYVGEMGSVSSNPGVQSWSITQGLFAGQVLGEMMNDGVSRATWWIGFGNCNGENGPENGNGSSSLYGWQNFGAYNVFADGSGDLGGNNNTACNYNGPIGTMSPTAVAFQLFSNLAITGQNVLPATVAGDTTDVRAYAATNPNGTALMLFNDNETTPQQVSITLSGKSSTAGVTLITYDKAIYDLSGSPTGTPADPAGTSTWAPPTTTTLGAGSLPLTLTLSPWSMNVLIVQ
jgi:hypothetical protein